MTARVTALMIMFVASTAAAAGAQTASNKEAAKNGKDGGSATESSQPAPTAKPANGGFEIPPFPPNPRVDKAKREAEARRKEYEDALARSRGEGTEAAEEQPARRVSSSARRPAYELFAGYAALHDATDSVNFPLGWAVALSRPFTDQVTIVGQASGNYKSAEIAGVNVGGANVHTFTAGPQLSREFPNHLRAFGQVQAGLAVGRVDVFGASDSSVGFAIIPGAGVDVPVVRELTVRIGGELPYVHNGGWWSGFRFLTGVVLHP